MDKIIFKVNQMQSIDKELEPLKRRRNTAGDKVMNEALRNNKEFIY